MPQRLVLELTALIVFLACSSIAAGQTACSDGLDDDADGILAKV